MSITDIKNRVADFNKTKKKYFSRVSDPDSGYFAKRPRGKKRRKEKSKSEGLL